MKIEINYDKNKSLLSSIFFLILGALFISNPDILYQIVAFVVGGIVLIYAVIKIYNYIREPKEEKYAKINLFKGAVAAVIGLILIFFPDIVEGTIRYLLGAWVLFSGIHQLISALSLSKNNNHLLSALLVSFLLIILSILIIFTDLLVDSIGIVMIIYSSLEIIGIVFNRRKVNKDIPKEGDTKLIIPDKKKDQK